MNIFRIITFTSLALILSSCASQTTPETKARQDLTLKAWLDCISKAVKTYDDGTPNPLVVATVIQPSCSQEKRASMSTVEPALTYEQHLRFEQRMEQTYIRSTAEIVLANRKKT